MMKINTLLASLVFFVFSIPVFCQNNIPVNKKYIINSVERHEKELTDLSDQIWAFAETALQAVLLCQ